MNKFIFCLFVNLYWMTGQAQTPGKPSKVKPSSVKMDSTVHQQKEEIYLNKIAPTTIKKVNSHQRPYYEINQIILWMIELESRWQTTVT